MAYINTSLPLAERRKRLKEKYHFECKCARCMEEEKRGDTTQTATATTSTAASASGSKDQCAECGEANGRLSLCGRCRGIAYCSTACQRKHWSAHKPTCKPSP